MGDKETMVAFASFASQNLVENLSFIPSDKWDYKPAAEAKSVREIIDHLLGNFAMFNGNFGGAKFERVTDLAAAKTALLQATQDYAANLLAATPEKLAELVEANGTQVPLSLIASMSVVDLLHHHGQIAYLQTLWGDTDSHFKSEAFGLIS